MTSSEEDEDAGLAMVEGGVALDEKKKEKKRGEG